jgi:hypothetical protein
MANLDWINFGDGDGYGYGHGYGDGRGHGDGYGHGDGDGDEAYWLSAIASYASRWPKDQQAAYRSAVASGAQIAYWKSAADGMPCNGGARRTEEIAKPGLIQKILGPLKICSSSALHGTSLPHKWEGERTWIVALYGEIQQKEDKFGALKREILGEC